MRKEFANLHVMRDNNEARFIVIPYTMELKRIISRVF